MPTESKKTPSKGKRSVALPIAAPERRPEKPGKPGAPDLHIEEIEERHIPKDRNIFDK
jgi:hypothetical protein